MSWLFDLLLKISSPLIAHAIIRKYELYCSNIDYKSGVDLAAQRAAKPGMSDDELREAAFELKKAILSAPDQYRVSS